MVRVKVSIIGSGRIGATTGYAIAVNSLVDELVLIDINEKLAVGESLDISHTGSAPRTIGTTHYEDIADSEVVIIAAGFSRTADMSRLDLLKKNVGIIKSVAESVSENAPDCKIIQVTNPMDVMTYIALKSSGFDDNKVIGFGGVLDCQRLKYYISDALNIPPSSVNTMIIGEHGDSMAPLISSTTVNGKPLVELLSKEQIRECVEKTKKGGASVISRKGATIFAPASGVSEMVKAIAKDEKEILPASVYSEEHDICIGMPVKLGRNGVEEIVKPEMSVEEEKMFTNSISVLKSEVAKARDIFERN